MKVGNLNPISFRSSSAITYPKTVIVNSSGKSMELVNTTPDYAVVTPQKYQSLGVKTTDSGLNIYSYKLSNGHRVSIIPMEESPTYVKNYVNVGSMNETDDIKGISHFLEHMAFNGTKGTEGYLKLEQGDSFKKISELGGYTNASTNYALTDYENSTQMLNENDLEQQIKIIASMTEDLALTPQMIEKEKGPVSSEIDMILDSPDVLATDQNLRALFNIKSSADEMVGGSVNHIQNLTREKVLEYYNRYYTPDNMHLVITGNVDPNETMDMVAKYFHSNKSVPGKKFDTVLKPIDKTVRKDFITDKATSTTIMLGFAGPQISDVKANILSEVVASYLNSSELGLKKEFRRLFANIDFGMEKISTNKNNPTYLQLNAFCSDDNSEEVLKLLFDKLSDIKPPSEETLENIKNKLLMVHNDIQEHSYTVNKLIGTSIFNNDLEYLTDYESILKNISAKDVEEYLKKYLDIGKTSLTIVHPNVPETKIWDNYNKAQNLSFRGKPRKPLNTNNVENEILQNNYEIAFVKTKNNNIKYYQNLYYELPKNINPAARIVLDLIYSYGTKFANEDEYTKYTEDNNIFLNASVGIDCLGISGRSNIDTFDNLSNLSKELLYSPRIEQEEFDKAVAAVKDHLNRAQTTSGSLYEEFESKNSPYCVSKRDILEGLETLTLDDVKNLHDYIINNSKGTIIVNLPEKHKEFKEVLLDKFSELSVVKPYNYTLAKVYKPNEKPVLLQEAKNVSQADIAQIYKFKISESYREDVILKLMNSLLSSSHSIGLFDSLREKEHLAYRVGSSYDKFGDSGEVALYILTSTDNKDTGDVSYDNVQKSINGFHRQINKLLNSEYSDEDLENVKREYKSILLNNETALDKLLSVDSGLYYGEGVDYVNKKYALIDSITREDIDKIAKQVFSQPPVYSIVASQDTLDYNKEYLNSLV